MSRDSDDPAGILAGITVAVLVAAGIAALIITAKLLEIAAPHIWRGILRVTELVLSRLDMGHQDSIGDCLSFSTEGEWQALLVGGAFWMGVGLLVGLTFYPVLAPSLLFPALAVLALGGFLMGAVASEEVINGSPFSEDDWSLTGGWWDQ